MQLFVRGSGELCAEVTDLGNHLAAAAPNLGQGEFNADLNANFNADFNANGMLQTVRTPKVQRQWEAVSTPMGGLQIPTPKGF